MERFEQDLKDLVSQLSKYSLLEFYHDQNEIKSSISRLSSSLEEFTLYLPNSRLLIEDMTVAKNNIKVDIKERIYSFIEKIDHSFGLENYHYVLENINDDLVKDVYKKLGPFDHFQFKEEKDGETN